VEVVGGSVVLVVVVVTGVVPLQTIQCDTS
jgi:hypothetical protein